MMRRGITALRMASLLCAVSVVSACGTPRQAQQQRVAVIRPSAQSGGGRDHFEAELESQVRGRNDSDGGEVSGSVRLHIGDDSIVQYWLKIENPNADLFTAAQLRRLSKATGDPAVAVLFSNASARDRRLQLRGTLSVVKSGSLSRLIQDVKTNPDSFFVSVRGPAGREVMRGRLR